MARSQASFQKKEREKKKLQKRKEKEERLAERRASAGEGRTLEDMMAYVDEEGNLTTRPPDPLKKKSSVNEEEIELGSRNRNDGAPAAPRRGRVMFYNEAKGYGFIKDEESAESVFVHHKMLSFEPKGNDLVTFETERSPRGLSAVNVRKV